MNRHSIIVGIDPDTVKCGYAKVNKLSKRIIECGSYSFFNLTKKLLADKQFYKDDLIIVVEAGWLNEITNYHQAIGKQGQRISLNTGRNQQVGMLLVQFCIENEIEVIEMRPLKKTWKGKDRKITHAELSQFAIGLPKESNQEVRDSVLIAWHHANLPIKLCV